MTKKILIVGNGGREHAMLWKLAQDAPDAAFYITRGNGGTEGLATAIPLGPTEIQALAGWALREGIDLTVVGPEVPLAVGIVDHFSSQGLAIFGPSSAAAEIESSKAYAKGLMHRNGIPTAGFEVFTEVAPAAAYVRQLGAPVVVKASGLAAGKGAVVCQTEEEAIATVEAILSEKVFGAAGERVVIEEFMHGEELSVFAVTDGISLLMLGSAQDHKQIGEGDTGPNTGGMGAYAPVSIATPELMGRVEREILVPTIEALAADGHPYRGVLYAGLMLTSEGPKVVEFNCRFGDPEAQVIIPRMESSLLDVIGAVANGRPISELEPIRWKKAAAVTTVLASGGYPGDYRTGVPIVIPPDVETDDVFIFHAGTHICDGRLETSGGRVLAITALGRDVSEAAARSRAAAERIEFEGRTFRRDIAWREIGR
ncbi:MAG: phosphoribosylamine--glycine ligase [Gemmatimonadota bacterium]